MKIATAFSGGFGSVEFALKYLNIPHEIVFACEWKEPQRQSYINNHGNPQAFYEDIRNLDGNKYKGKIDYYHLSPPCQSYSMAGSREGAADERGALMFEAIKSIDQVQPKMFSVENVKGLLSSNAGEDWKNILKDFRSLKGYTITWGIMNAKEQGTPQNRERVFIVGFRGQAPHMSFPQKITLDKKLSDVLEDEVDEKYYLSQKMLAGFIKHKERHSEKGTGFVFSPVDKNGIANCLRANYFKMAPTDNYIIPCAMRGRYELDGKTVQTLEARDDEVSNTLTSTPKTSLVMEIKSNTKSGYEVAKSGDGISLSRPTSKTRRGRVGKQVAQTLDTSSSQGVLLNQMIRRLTPRECARVMGDFDDMFKLDGFSDSKLYEFIGNAMDISTTKNLITQMLKHCEIVKFTEPQETSFTQSCFEKEIDLFGEIV